MGKRVVPAGRRRRTGTRRGSGNGRGPAPRLVLPALALITVALGAGAALVHYDGPAKDTAAPAPGATTATPAPAPTPRPTTAKPKPKPEPKPKPKPKPTSSKKAEKAEKAENGQERVAVPRSGTGRFLTARASGPPVGHGGTLRRYRVQVEEGVALSATETAAEIQRVLAHPRGWAAHGRGRFQLVSENADFVIRIATPDTADALCREQGLDTRGELNCETTDGVVVNLKRWMLGSPTFAGAPAAYRHLIINHEVGHEIGIRQHLGCPGPGRPAPAMMQQIKGLNGCHSNAFPYAEDGSYITGPIVS
ncbi:DUF3152 domain-containing protein [Streptomyces sp. NPDC059247]|uniref:DUF3152 domain-containing protein n=1 Tax=Streptomyces sp. NPDC059247 TaxID=3346790 RepID=UPI003697A1F5